jgi:uncharacterized membrane protein
MHISRGLDLVRTFFILLWGGLCALIIAAPLLLAFAQPLPAALIYFFFSPVCHQQPERSFVLMGYSLAVCHRCFGIYAGLLTGCVIRLPARFVYRSPSWRRALVLAGAAPLLLDALLPMTGLWTGHSTSRFFTGLLFGVITSALVAPGIAEIFSNLSISQLSLKTTNAKGGVS